MQRAEHLWGDLNRWLEQLEASVEHRPRTP